MTLFVYSVGWSRRPTDGVVGVGVIMFAFGAGKLKRVELDTVTHTPGVLERITKIVFSDH